MKRSLAQVYRLLECMALRLTELTARSFSLGAEGFRCWPGGTRTADAEGSQAARALSVGQSFC